MRTRRTSHAQWGAAIIDVLPRGTVVRAVGRASDSVWLLVVLPDGQLAWLLRDAVFYVPGEVAALPVVAP